MSSEAPRAAAPWPPQGGARAPEGDGPPEPNVPTLESKDLLQGRRDILIRHQGQHYRLQATRQGKLILTK